MKIKPQAITSSTIPIENPQRYTNFDWQLTICIEDKYELTLLLLQGIKYLLCECLVLNHQVLHDKGLTMYINVLASIPKYNNKRVNSLYFLEIVPKYMQ